MPEFLFAATDPAGNRVQGTTSADTMSTAVLQVSGMGYSLLHIELSAGDQQPATSGVQPTLSMQAGSIPSAPAPMPTPPDRTEVIQAVPALQPAPQNDLLKSDPIARKKVEADLSKLGLAPEEIRRLMNASSSTFESDGSGGPSPVQFGEVVAPRTAKSNRVTAASLESFAAQLTSANAAKSTAAVRKVELGLPAFRESTTEEKLKSEACQRDGNLLRRREKHREAEAKVREAISLTPSDPAALELLGDVLQGVGRVDEALAAYKRGAESDPKRSSVEKKYGDLLMRQQNWSFADPEAVPPNRWFNSIVSLCFPGIGQLLNGDWAKAAVFLGLDLVCAYLLFYSPWRMVGGSHVRPVTMVAFGLTIATFLAGFIDSNISAARKNAN